MTVVNYEGCSIRLQKILETISLDPIKFGFIRAKRGNDMLQFERQLLSLENQSEK